MTCRFIGFQYSIVSGSPWFPKQPNRMTWRYWVPALYWVKYGILNSNAFLNNSNLLFYFLPY